ncbi:hypothetical protein MMC21_003693 [Puttea exsequens]|nr:hypothetical protein [Puttea exsequens]
MAGNPCSHDVRGHKYGGPVIGRTIRSPTRADLINFISAYFFWQQDGRDPYQNALDAYLGTDSIGKDSQETVDDVEGNYARAADSTAGSARENADFYIFCKESEISGGCAGRPLRVGSSTYDTASEDPKVRKEYSWFLLCDPFWKMPTFGKVLEGVDKDETIDPADMNTWFPNQALFFMASLFSLSPIINSAEDVVQANFGTVYPLQTMNFAKEKNTASAKKNGFSYAYAALSEWLQIVFDLSSPALPKAGNSTTASLDSASSMTPTIETSLFVPPTAFPGIPRTAGQEPDSALWVTMNESDAIDTALAPPALQSSNAVATKPTDTIMPTVTSTGSVLCDDSKKKAFGTDQSACNDYCGDYLNMKCTSVGPFPGVPDSVATWTCECDGT